MASRKSIPLVNCERSNPSFFADVEWIARRFAPLRKRLAFVAGNDGEIDHLNAALTSFIGAISRTKVNAPSSFISRALFKNAASA